MNRYCLKLVAFLAVTSSTWGFEKLPEQYLVTYGNPNAPIKVVEFFSLACPGCLRLINNDFPSIKKDYIDKGNVYWIFHLDPIDKSTLQAMICIGRLDAELKRKFLEQASQKIAIREASEACSIMQELMAAFQYLIPDLEQMTYLKGTEEFIEAFKFLKQNDGITSFPTVEIDGKILDEYPTHALLESEFLKRLNKVDSCAL